MMNEINKLIWPNKAGIGLMSKADFNRTAKIAKAYGVIKKAPKGAYIATFAKEAIAGLKAKGMDVYGKKYKPLMVHVTAGGK